ncbi:MAG: efflux RND transporter permease subunit, partial [Acidobacteriota bacterium]
MTTGGHTRGGLIAFLVRNSVAANLLMLLILIGGAVTAYTVPMEVFAETSFDFITVTVEYRGAAPEEVEDGVCTRIEEAVVDLEAIREMRSTANEGVCTVSLELIDGSDMRLALEDVKARVDAIDTFPDETEKPVIREAVPRRQVVNVAVAGTTDIKILKQLAERVRDEIAALDGITQVELAAVPPYEVSIEVAERDLRRFGLTFDDVAMAVRRSSIDLPGGTIRAASGEILLRTEGQAYRGAEFESLVLRTRGDGTRLVLGDVATIRDGFADADVGARFDGRNAALVQVFRVGEQSATEIAHKVASYVERSNEWMPAGIELMLWQDNSKLLESRLDTLLRNGRAGLVLVLILLALFLRLRLAFWVAVGIGVSFLGTLWVMPVLGATINVISLFAFIVAIGIVVDDTIVVGENIYRHHEMGKDGATAAIDGAREVAVPVIFSVLTTIAAFAALFVVPSGTGKILGMIPVIVIAALVFSLVESLCILPAHLSHLHRKRDR